MLWWLFNSKRTRVRFLPGETYFWCTAGRKWHKNRVYTAALNYSFNCHWIRVWFLMWHCQKPDIKNLLFYSPVLSYSHMLLHLMQFAYLLSHLNRVFSHALTWVYLRKKYCRYIDFCQQLLPNILWIWVKQQKLPTLQKTLNLCIICSVYIMQKLIMATKANVNRIIWKQYWPLKICSNFCCGVIHH